MAEIQLLVCDACEKQPDQDQRVEAVSTMRLVIEGQPLRIDACANHAQEFSTWLATLRDVGWQDDQQLSAVGQLPRQARKAKADLINSPGATGCPVCFRLLSTPGNMGHHLRKMHLRKQDEWTPEERQQATAEARRRLAADEGERQEQ